MNSLAIIQTGPCDLIGSLKALRDLIPAALVDRAEEFDLAPDAELPRQVTCIPEADDEAEAQLKQALASLPHDGLVVQRGAFFALMSPPASPVTRALDEVVTQLRPDLPQLDQADPDPAKEIWKAVLERKSSGRPFPQENYEGPQKKVYHEIIDQLGGLIPHEDGGRILNTDRLDLLKRPRGMRKRAWDGVIDDLRLLLYQFGKAREWFGSTGEFRNLVRDEMFADMGFMARLNADYGLCDADASAALEVDQAVAITARILSTPYPLVGFAFHQLAKVVLANRPAGGEVRAKIAQMEAALLEVFEATIQTIEQALIALVADWGNLVDFVEQVEQDKIAWPDAAAEIRRAHKVGFHTACLKTLMKLKSDTESRKVGNKTVTWGVVQYRQSCGKRNRKYDAKTGVLRGKSSEADCFGGRTNTVWFFGRVETSPGSGWGPPPPRINAAPKELANKLFLAGTDADPGLGLSDKFLDTPKKRASWGLHSVTAKGGGKI